MKKTLLLLLFLLFSSLSGSEDYSRRENRIQTPQTIDMQGKTRCSATPMFLVDKPVLFELKNGTIQNTGDLNTKEMGGVLALINGASAKISGVTFTNNGSHNWSTYGGAVLVRDHCSLEVNDCKFSENKAQHGAALSVMANESVVRVTDTVFTENHAKSPAPGNFGGAIFLQGGIDFSYTVSEGKTIVVSGNTAYSGGFIHTHNAGIKMLFDIKKDASLVVGSRNEPRYDTINLVNGATLTKRGEGSMRINSMITRHFSQIVTSNYDIVVEEGLLAFGNAQRFPGNFLITGGNLALKAPFALHTLEIRPENGRPVSVIGLENLKEGNCILNLGAGENFRVEIGENKFVFKHSDGRKFQLDPTVKEIRIGKYRISRKEIYTVSVLSVVRVN